ncbi:MAG: hypothetical protein JWM25_249 [Thermoleophilia bacterium]|nr:hypothetical protein [Thermoleophilia bacterium]MCZ4495666.1 hypothetical protein [Thermoleophilia bacterium]
MQLPTSPTTTSPSNIVQAQPRFRIDGTGPVSQRSITPVTTSATALMAQGSAATDAVRGVLRLVEDAAGGAAASARVDVNGVALAFTPHGHATNVFAAHADEDPAFGAEYRAATPAGQRQLAQELHAEAMRTASGGEAMVTSGWVNLAATASRGLLGAASGAASSDEAALAIRIARHEAQHLADDSKPSLDEDGTRGLREALAEAHSTRLPQLQRARALLGLDQVVSDASLHGAIANRPYREYEADLASLLQRAGIDPVGPVSGALLAKPSNEVADTLANGIARHSGASVEQARAQIAAAFADSAHGH